MPDVCTFVLNSLGAWLACQECTGLIEQENWEGLLERSFRTFCETHGPELVLTPADESVIREFLRHIDAQFRRFRGSATQPSARWQSFARVNWGLRTARHGLVLHAREFVDLSLAFQSLISI